MDFEAELRANLFSVFMPIFSIIIIIRFLLLIFQKARKSDRHSLIDRNLTYFYSTKNIETLQKAKVRLILFLEKKYQNYTSIKIFEDYNNRVIDLVEERIISDMNNTRKSKSLLSFLNTARHFIDERDISSEGKKSIISNRIMSIVNRLEDH